MPKLFQNKSLLKSIQVFLVCLVVLLLPKLSAHADTWVEKADMLNQLRFPFAAVVNNKIYVFGESSTLEEYDPATDTWIAIPSSEVSRRLFAVAAVDNKIYIMGGYSGGFMAGTASKVLKEYDPATNTWTAKSDMLNVRSDFAAVTVDDKIYAIGGRTGGIGGVILSTVEEYDPATNTWTPKADMPTIARRWLAATTVNGKIYAIGGYNGGPLSTVEEYDPATNTWTAKADMPTARYGLAAATVNGKIYAIGGYNGGPLSTVEEYDPATNTWTARPSIPMPTARYSLTAVAAGNKIYAIGGFGGTDKETEELSITISSSPPSPPPSPPPPTECKPGLVPCGRICDVSSTPYREDQPCTICHLVLMMQLIMDFLFKIAAVVAAFFIAASGTMYIVSAGRPELLSLSKTTFKTTLLGFILVFIAWVLVNTILTMFGYIDPLRDGNWHIIC